MDEWSWMHTIQDLTEKVELNDGSFKFRYSEHLLTPAPNDRSKKLPPPKSLLIHVLPNNVVEVRTVGEKEIHLENSFNKESD